MAEDAGGRDLVAYVEPAFTALDARSGRSLLGGLASRVSGTAAVHKVTMAQRAGR